MKRKTRKNVPECLNNSKGCHGIADTTNATPAPTCGDCERCWSTKCKHNRLFSDFDCKFDFDFPVIDFPTFDLPPLNLEPACYVRGRKSRKA